MTCTSTNHSILEQFATPIFADIQYDTGNIDPKDVERRITSRTKAIMCTHWGGDPCDLEDLHAIAKRHNLTVIEDASEAMGAMFRCKPIGAVSRFTAFSFNAIQAVTSGEGGALATLYENDAEVARIQRWYGIDRKGRQSNSLGYFDFDIMMKGFGYHMTNISAAIGIESLKCLPKLLSRRQMMAERYQKELVDVPGITLLRSCSDRISANHFFTVHVERRADFFRKLKESGIEVSVVHYRNDAYSVFGGLRQDLPELERFCQSYIALPTHTGLKDEDVAHIIATIQSGW